MMESLLNCDLKQVNETISLGLAVKLCELSGLIYLNDEWWASSKEGKGKADNPDDFSLHCKYWVGHIKEVTPWGFQTIPHSYNCRFNKEQGTVRNGMIVEREKDTEGIFLLDEVKKQVVLAIRGTSSGDDIVTDLVTWFKDSPYGPGSVHSGFLSTYSRCGKAICHVVDKLFSKGKYTKLIITGHSLGGALATLAAVHIKKNCTGVSDISVVTFGAPRVGDQEFVDDYNLHIPDTWRFVNDEDIVPDSPPKLMGYRHVGTQVYFNNTGIWINPDEDIIEEGDDSVSCDDDVMAECVSDHFITNYRNLLRQFFIIYKLDRDIVQSLYKIWNQYLSSPPRTEVVLQVRRDNKMFGDDVNYIVPQKIETANHIFLKTRLHDLLDDKFDFDINANLKYLVIEMFRLSSYENIEFHHFLGALWNLLLNPSSGQIEVNLNVARHRELFFSHDSDSDDFLTKEEFINCYREMHGYDDDEKQIDELFKNLDIDINMKISFQEFILWKILESG